MNDETNNNKIYKPPSFKTKDSFFSKLFSSFGRKALPPADGVIRTNASMSSLMARGSLRASLINLGNKIQNIFTPKKELEPQNTLTAQVVSENDKTKIEIDKTKFDDKNILPSEQSKNDKTKNEIDKTKFDDKNILPSEQSKIVIPTPKNVVKNTSIINNNQPPKLTVEEINIDSDAILENTKIKIDDNMLSQENLENTQGIQAVTMTVDDKNKKLKEDINRISKPEVTHELDF